MSSDINTNAITEDTKSIVGSIKETVENIDKHNIDKTPISKSYMRSQRMQTSGKTKCIEKFLVFLSFVIVIITFPLSLLFIFVALTKDSLTVSVDAVIYYKICEPVWAIINVANFKSSTQFLAATTLRNAIGSTKLSDLLNNRPAVSQQVFQQMRDFTKEWGIQVIRIEIKDISLPVQLQKVMAAEAESSRLANAKIIVAKAEIESTKNLQTATAMLLDNPFTMQLRYLQSLHMIAGDQTHTVVFPFSTETISKILQR